MFQVPADCGLRSTLLTGFYPRTRPQPCRACTAEHAREFGCKGASSVEDQIEDLMSTSGSWLPAFLRVRFDILADLLDCGGCVIHGWLFAFCGADV